MRNMDILDYTDEQLEALSDDELLKLHTEACDKAFEEHINQLTKKILINSLYGATANAFFPLYNIGYASGITCNGRYFIQKTADYIEEKLQSLLPWDQKYITYGDTDSVYYTIEPFVNKYEESHQNADVNELVDFCNDFSDKVIQPIIDKSIEDMSRDFNVFDRSRIQAKKEVVCDVMVNCAKKKYYARVRDSEGTRYDVNNPHIKVMGLELAKSTTPLWVKDNIQGALPILFDSDKYGLVKWVDEIRGMYTQASIDDIAQVGRANKLSYTLGDKSVPMLSRCAIVYNNFLRDNNLESSYSSVEPSEKFKYVRLITPNVFKSDCIAYKDSRFADVYLKDIIDYETMFKKSFIEPLNLMCECMGYNLKSATVEVDEW